MKISDIREYTDEELVKGLEDAQREYLNLRIQAKTGQLENTARLRLVRRDIARIRSIENERHRNAN
ncbi:MAG: 50S ribosomal protein L29 [Lentisphaeria bacterium]|jgi:large subunit ribosomal protein L29|nr:50S ribosomal protein L29 [Lentisphaeria bacterium]MDP7740224.1 50S ribosomal protein L29 [Lentisphaeria bacterium]